MAFETRWQTRDLVVDSERWPQGRIAPGLPPPASGQVSVYLVLLSGPLQFEVAPDCVGEGFEILWIGGDDEIAASQRSFCDTRVNNVRCACLGGESADGARSVIIEDLDVAASQQLGEQGLASTSTPALGNDWCRHRRDGAKREECAVSSPHLPLTPVGGDERTGVVRHTHQAVRRPAAPLRTDRLTASVAHACASAISVSVKAPFTRSNSATPCRPS